MISDTDEKWRGVIKIYRNPVFLASDGQPGEGLALDPFYMEIPCQIEDGRIVVPSFEIPSTDPETVE